MCNNKSSLSREVRILKVKPCLIILFFFFCKLNILFSRPPAIDLARKRISGITGSVSPWIYYYPLNCPRGCHTEANLWWHTAHSWPALPLLTLIANLGSFVWPPFPGSMQTARLRKALLHAIFNVKAGRVLPIFAYSLLPASLILALTLSYLQLEWVFTELAAYYPCPTLSSSVAQSCLTLCDPMDYSMPGLPVHHQLHPNFCPRHFLISVPKLINPL